MENFSIDKTIRGSSPKNVPFAKIKVGILGASYELSLVLIGDTLARRLNKEHKGKTNPTNVLSFPISDTEGEIFINVRRAQRDAKKFGQTWREHVAFLFIHGCLHLRGEEHGEQMEHNEDKYLKKYL